MMTPLSDVTEMAWGCETTLPSFDLTRSMSVRSSTSSPRVKRPRSAASGAASRIEQVHQTEADADTSQQLRTRRHMGELLLCDVQCKAEHVATVRPSRSSSLAHCPATYRARLQMDQLPNEQL